jgi:hypothetical protein
MLDSTSEKGLLQYCKTMDKVEDFNQPGSLKFVLCETVFPRLWTEEINNNLQVQ